MDVTGEEENCRIRCVVQWKDTVLHETFIFWLYWTVTSVY
jgi:hypothetical protein